MILMNKFFKWASICNFILGGFILFISLLEYSSVLLGIGMIQLVLGLYYLQCSHQDIYTMYQNRISVLLLGIVNFIPNFISSAFVFNAYDKIKIEYKKGNYKKKKISKKRKEQLQLNRVLNIGVGLILIAGYLFLNTNISVVQPWSSVLVMLLFAGIFYALYLFNQKYIQHEYSLKIYYILSMFFLLLGYFGIGKYGLLGDWLSIYGEGKYVFFTLFFLLFSLVSIFSYKAFKNKNYLYGVYAGIFFAPIYYLSFAGADIYLTILTMDLIITLVSMLDFKNKDITVTFHPFLKVASYFLAFMFVIGTNVQNTTLYIMAAILTLCNLYYLNIYHSNKGSSILTTLFGFLLFPVIVCHLNLGMMTSVYTMLLINVLITTILLFNKRIKNDSFFHRTSIVGLNLYSLFIYIFSFSASSFAPVLVAFTILFLHFVYLTIYDNTECEEYYTQAIKIGLLVYACFNFLQINDASVIFTVISVLYVMLARLTVEKKLKWSYILTLFATFAVAFVMTMIDQNMISAFVLLLMSCYFTYRIRKSDNKEICRLYPAAYLTLLLMLYDLVSVQNVFQFQPIYNHIIVLFAFVGGMVANLKNKTLLQLTSIAFLFPSINILLDINHVFFMQDIIFNILCVVLVLLLCEYGIKKDTDKNIVSTVFIALLLVNVIFSTNEYVAIYVSILTVLLMFYSIYRPIYNTLFIVSVFGFVLNLLIHMNYILTIIPLWSYLLVMGIIIIGVVVCKEIKRKEDTK